MCFSVHPKFHLVIPLLSQTRNIPVERGSEHWAIGMHPSGRPGIDGADVLITALHHCGRTNWQPELWIPDNIRR